MSEFDAEFELDILARCARDPNYRRQARRVLDEHTFSDPAHSWLWRTMAGLGNQDKLTGGLVVLAAKKTITNEDDREEHLRAARMVLRHEPEAPIAALRELEDFRSFHQMSAAIDSALKLMGKGDVRAARLKLREATRSRDALSYSFTDYFEDFEKRQERRQYLRDHPEENIQIPTKFLPSFDRAMRGGIEVEVGLLVATTGRGKSMLAANLAFTAAAQGFRTLYISTEMEHDLTATRIDARMFQVPYDQFKTFDFSEDELEEIAVKQRRFAKRLRGKLRVASMPLRFCTYDVVNQMLDDMAEEEQGPAKMIVFDSLDHMVPSEKVGDRRARETAAYTDGKSIAEERRCALWATTHAPKDVVNKIATAENVGESYDKARLADIVITINENKALALKGRMKLYLAKYRQGKSRVLIQVEVDKARMTYQEVEAEEVEEGEDE